MENFYYKIILKDEPTPKIVNEQNKNKILQLIKQKEQLIEIGSDYFDRYDILKIKKIEFDLEKHLIKLNKNQKEKFLKYISNYNKELKFGVVQSMFEESLKN